MINNYIMNNNKYIILEGPDNCGKSTQASLIIKNLDHLTFHKLHYSSLPFDSDQSRYYSSIMYRQMFAMMEKLKFTKTNLIFDRSHLGESVYSDLYRGYSGDYVFDIENGYVNSLKNHLYLITLINNHNIIADRDDGKSTYSNTDDIETEVRSFMESHKKSNINNKLLVDVGNMDENEVNKMIVDFIITN